MRIKTGEAATVTLPVKIAYRCSSCGKTNVFQQQITSIVQTPTIAGINLRNDLAGKATQNLSQIVTDLLNPTNPQRFRAAQFDCKCSNCKHREPWARMTYPFLKILYVVLWIVIVFASMFFLGSLSDPFETLFNVSLTILVACIMALFSIRFIKSAHSAKMEKHIAKLPPESLPNIILPSNKPPVGSTPSVPYGMWLCYHCGTQNSTQYTQCKKCGKYKDCN